MILKKNIHFENDFLFEKLTTNDSNKLLLKKDCILLYFKNSIKS